jgi:hypothetical protein
MEGEFEEEKGRRSLASIFESDEDDVLEVDAEMQDDSLLVTSSRHPPTHQPTPT